MSAPVEQSAPSTPSPPAQPKPAERWAPRDRRIGLVLDRLFKWVCQAAALLVVVLAVLLVSILVWKSWEALRTIGPGFFTHITWDPEPSHRKFGALAFIYGTVATSAIAMLIAVPLGVGTATFLAEIAPRWVRRIGSFAVEMLAAVPSVVYGFWGLFVLAPLLQHVYTAVGGPNQGGVGLFAAGLILSIMVVPYIAAVSYDACRAVPQSQRSAALALGATRWQTIWSAILPVARPGIIGGCFLGLGRALGETMAVTMLIGNRPEIRFSPFAMGNSIASVIANEFTEATYDLYLSALVELGLVLLVVSLVINSFARILIWKVTRSGSGPLFTWRFRAPKKPLDASPESNTTESPGVKPRPVRDVVRWSRSKHVWSRWTDRLMTWVLGFCLVLTTVPLVFILGYLVYQGIGALNWEFFVKLPAPVGEKGGGMANALYGSLLLVGLATLFAVPAGILGAIFLAEYRSKRLAPVVRFIGELLTGVPSIVIGIFAYNLVVKPMGNFSGWAGAFALGMMMLPIVMRTTEEALKIVPDSLRYASYALGATRYQTVLRVVLPSAFPSVITAVFLAIARVAGETAPLLLTASSNQYWPSSPNDFTPSLPVYIFTYAVSPYEDWHRQAWAAALVLLGAILLLNFGVRLLAGKRSLVASRAD